MMLKVKSIITSTVVLLFILSLSNNAAASVIDIAEFTSFINATELGADSLRDSQIGFGINEFASAGLALNVTNNLGADSLGTISIMLTNNSGAALTNVRFFGFLDAQIDELTNSFFNESGSAAGLVMGGGSSDSLADFWEIDEPGFLFGDIFDNLLAGTLDNTNAFDSAPADDVSLALGFDIGTLAESESIIATFEISSTPNSGLRQNDPDSGGEFFFGGSAWKKIVEIPAPGTLALLMLGLFFINSRTMRAKQV